MESSCQQVKLIFSLVLSWHVALCSPLDHHLKRFSLSSFIVLRMEKECFHINESSLLKSIDRQEELPKRAFYFSSLFLLALMHTSLGSHILGYTAYYYRQIYTAAFSNSHTRDLQPRKPITLHKTHQNLIMEDCKLLRGWLGTKHFSLQSLPVYEEKLKNYRSTP